jgi:beta-lactamase class A
LVPENPALEVVSMNSRSFAALVGGACLAFVAALAARQARPQPKPLAAPLAGKLQAALERTAASVDGVMGIYAENLQTGQTFAVNADRLFPQGSSIKIPILITLLRQDQQGRLHLSDQVVVRKADIVGGSGVLQDFGDGSSSLALRDLAALMVVLSDNSATNILIDRVGMANVNAEIREAGLAHTRLARKMMDQAAERAGHENVSTPREMATLVEKLERGRLLDAEHTALALGLLEDYKETPLRAGIPAGITVADKPGSLPGVECDSGLVLLQGAPYVLSVMTAYDHDNAAADAAITSVSRDIFGYFDRLARSNSSGAGVLPAATH